MSADTMPYHSANTANNTGAPIAVVHRDKMLAGFESFVRDPQGLVFN